MGEELLIHPVRGAAERKLAKRRQIGGGEKMRQGPLGLIWDVDLAFFETLNQIVRGEIDQFDGVGAIEHAIGHGLAHADMRDLSDDVVQAFDVLNVDWV